jgi:histidinol-phosphate aminotransferase
MRPDLRGVPVYRPGRPTGETEHLTALASNENPYPPLPSVVDAITSAALQVHRYPEMTAATLGHAVADHLGVPVDDVVLGPGSVGVLQALVTAMAGPGDEVVFAWRSFEAYPIVARVCGATPVPVPLAAGGRHDVGALADAMTPRTRLLLVCSPNNPTGPVVTRDELDWLLQHVPDDVLVVLDEAYVEFVRDPAAADGLAAYRERENVAVLRTFSKAYGLAGLRVGYGIAHAPVASAVRTTSLPFGVSGPAQAAAAASLRHADELAQRVDTIVAERERVVAALAAGGCKVPSSQANFVWLEAGEATTDLAVAFRRAGLAVRAFDGDGDRSGVRLTIGAPDDNDRALDVAATWISGTSDGGMGSVPERSC